MVTLSSTGSVKQLPRGAKNENGPTSKQAPGESYQGATTFFSMALAKTLLLFPTSFKRIDLFSFYVKINDDENDFLVIGSRQQLLKILHCSVRVGTIQGWIQTSATSFQKLVRIVKKLKKTLRNPD